MEVFDGSRVVAELRESAPELFEGLQEPLNPRVAARDGMFTPDRPAHYFRCGLNALQLIRQSLPGVRTGPPHSILDFACGYGRVLRALKACFPGASILGLDLDKNAIAAVRELLGIECRPSERDLAALRLDRRFDLIWVGSLFTHVDSAYADALLEFLADRLAPSGILAFTTHGHYVRERIQRREKAYNLDEEAIAELLESARSAYGFAPYPGRADYGIAVAGPLAIIEKIETVKLRALHFVERGWDRHQDFYACGRI